jgi:hypothetical protein
MGAGSNCLCPVSPIWIIGEEFREVMDHGSARPRRTNNRLGITLFKLANESFGKSSRFSSVPCIECRLPAASLPVVKLDFTANATQHFDSAYANGAPKLIDEAGDKETYEHF